MRLAEQPHQLVVGDRRPGRRTVRDADPAQPLGGGRPDAGDRRDRQRVRGSSPPCRRDDDQPVGLVQVAGDLGHQLRGADAHRPGEPAGEPRAIRTPEVARRPRRSVAARCVGQVAGGEVDERLVQRQRLDQRGELAAARAITSSLVRAVDVRGGPTGTPRAGTASAPPASTSPSGRRRRGPRTTRWRPPRARRPRRRRPACRAATACRAARRRRRTRRGRRGGSSARCARAHHDARAGFRPQSASTARLSTVRPPAPPRTPAAVAVVRHDASARSRP